MDFIFRPAVAMYLRFTNIVRFPIVGGFFVIPLAIAMHQTQGKLSAAALVSIAATLLLAVYFLAGLYFSSKHAWGIVNRLAKRINEHDLSELEDTEAARSLLRGQFGQIYKTLNQALDNLREIVGQVNASSETIRVSAKEIAAGHVSLSQRTEEQASALQETAAGMEELAGTAKQNADKCRLASGLSKSASDVAEQGVQTVRRVVDRMAMIDRSSKKIGDIVGLIEDIAFQTNLLALNAAVEAARAGEQGRGFTVVASEVRNLAQRSALAAKEVKTLIRESASDVEQGGKFVAEAGGIIDKMVKSVREVTDLIGEIAVASEEQNKGVEQINKTLSQLEGVTQQNASLVEETTAATLSFEEQTNRLTAAVARFKFASRAQDKGVVKPASSQSLQESQPTVTRPDTRRAGSIRDADTKPHRPKGR